MEKKEINQEEYVSLSEATKHCNYSQEYLSLRARTGKLKAIKIGRNWVTKKVWLEEYARKVEEYNNLIESKKVEEFSIQETAVQETPTQETVVQETPVQEPIKMKIEAPNNLPVEGEFNLAESKNMSSPFVNFINSLKGVVDSKIVSGAVAVLAVGLFALSFYIGEKGFYPVKNFIIRVATESYYIIDGKFSATVGENMSADFSREIGRFFRNDSIFVQDMARGAEKVKEESKKLTREIFFQMYIIAEAGNIITEWTKDLFYGSFKTVSEDVNRLVAITAGWDDGEKVLILSAERKSTISINEGLAQLSQIYFSDQLKGMILFFKNASGSF